MAKGRKVQGGRILSHGTVCVSRGFCNVVQSGLRACVLSMVHEGHLGIVKVKQRCCDLVWWPGIYHDIETLVSVCAACLLSGKTGRSAQPPPAASRMASPPLDICCEIHGHTVPHHQRFLVVAYELSGQKCFLSELSQHRPSWTS